MGETEIEGDASRFFFRQAIGIGAGERFNECALAVIHVSGGGDDEIACTHALQLTIGCGRAGGANSVDDRVVLMRKDRAQIEFERFVPDITDDWRSECA